MDNEFQLPNGIVLSAGFVTAIRQHQLKMPDLRNCVCTITLVKRLKSKQRSQWSIVWLPLTELPAGLKPTMIDGVRFALSQDVESQLGSCVVDFVDGHVQLK
jgi:hypothetical protein